MKGTGTAECGIGPARAGGMRETDWENGRQQLAFGPGPLGLIMFESTFNLAQISQGTRKRKICDRRCRAEKVSAPGSDSE